MIITIIMYHIQYFMPIKTNISCQLKLSILIFKVETNKHNAWTIINN